MKEHKCEISYSCSCYGGDYPNDDCYMHGGGPIYPPKCDICGRFFKE